MQIKPTLNSIAGREPMFCHVHCYQGNKVLYPNQARIRAAGASPDPTCLSVPIIYLKLQSRRNFTFSGGIMQ